MTTQPRNIYRNVYQDTSRKFNGMLNVLTHWTGSVYKLIWHEFLYFLLLYTALSLLYRFVLFHYPVPREIFELICVYSSRFSGIIPISFLTGFYVTQVVSRWWDQFMSLPWPDKIALRLVSYCPGKDHFRKHLRRTIMRYVNLSTILVYRLVSLKAKARFPDYQSLIDAKLILPKEIERLKRTDAKTPHESTWAPILWACKLLQKARTQGKITIEPPVYANLISSFDYIEGCHRKILNYGWVNFPLAYTQVATLSVFVYCSAALFGRQYLIPREESISHDVFPHANITFSNTKPFDKHTPDFYFPFFTFIEILSYMGWIKVAETLLNPFGDDDEDFQVNYMIDRNLQVSYLIVDEAEEEFEMDDDPFLEAGIDIPTDLPTYINKSSKALPSSPNLAKKNQDGQSATPSLKRHGMQLGSFKLNLGRSLSKSAGNEAQTHGDDPEKSSMYHNVTHQSSQNLNVETTEVMEDLSDVSIVVDRTGDDSHKK